MLALTFSILLTLYLVIPDALFRYFFSRHVPLRTLVPTKIETIYRAVVLAILPFALATILVFWIWPFDTYPLRVDAKTEAKWTDYKLVAASLYSEDVFKKNYEQFWPALNRSFRRQSRLLLWYYALVVLEGYWFGSLSANYGKYQKNGFYRVVADNLLLPNISQWHVLLTRFVFEDKDQAVRVDVLCSDGTLYDGKVLEYFLNDTALSGMILGKPRRFDRKSLLADRDKGMKPETTNYWRDIPSAKLYLFADKILNINLKEESIEKFVSASIGGSISITFTEAPAPAPSPTTQPKN